MKVRKPFNFSLPVTMQSRINGKLTQTLIGDLEVSGTAYLYFNAEDDPDVDYDSILWNGTDIFPLLDNLTAADDLMQYVHDAVHEHIRYILISNFETQDNE